MAINYDKLLALKIPDAEHSYTDKDTMLYALGVGFGYIVIVENLVRGLRPAWAPWLLTENAGLFLIGDPADFPQLHRSVVGAGIYLAVVATLLLVAAASQFRVRDVAV